MSFENSSVRATIFKILLTFFFCYHRQKINSITFSQLCSKITQFPSELSHTTVLACYQYKSLCMHCRFSLATFTAILWPCIFLSSEKVVFKHIYYFADFIFFVVRIFSCCWFATLWKLIFPFSTRKAQRQKTKFHLHSFFGCFLFLTIKMTV